MNPKYIYKINLQETIQVKKEEILYNFFIKKFKIWLILDFLLKNRIKSTKVIYLTSSLAYK